MCPRSNGSCVVLCALLLSATAVRAQEAPAPAPSWQPETAAHLGGPHGLTGFGSMVDGRIPSPFFAEPQAQGPLGAYSSRFALRYDLSLRRRELRGELLAGRFRNISEKHSLLAAFVAERPAGESWHERMTAWNKRHPKWKYSWPSNFARDSARAQQRLLQPAFRLKFVKRRRRTRDADAGRRGKATRRRRTQAR